MMFSVTGATRTRRELSSQKLRTHVRHWIFVPLQQLWVSSLFDYFYFLHRDSIRKSSVSFSMSISVWCEVRSWDVSLVVGWKIACLTIGNRLCVVYVELRVTGKTLCWCHARVRLIRLVSDSVSLRRVHDLIVTGTLDSRVCFLSKLQDSLCAEARNMTPHGRGQFDHPVFKARIKLLIVHDKHSWFVILYSTIVKSDWCRSWDYAVNFSSMTRVTRNMMSRFLMGVLFRWPWNREKTVLLSYASYLSTDTRVTQDSLFQNFCTSSLCSRNVDINPVLLWQVSFMTFTSDCLTLICIVFIWIRSDLELYESPERRSLRTHWLHDVLTSSFCHVSAVQVIIV